MPQCKLYSATCWSVLVFAMTSWCCAFQATPAPPDGQRTPQNTTDYAAVVAFREVIKSHSFALPEEKVRAVVLTWLRRDTNQPPKSMPAVEQLQGDLDLDFDATWTEMINQAAAGLDPDGKLGVAKRLRDVLDQNPKLRNEANAKHNDLLQNDMPKALERVKGALVKEQGKQLIDTLNGVVSTDMPGQQQVSDAQAGDRTQATKILTTEVLREMQKGQEDLLAVLIVESFQALSAAADNVVSDGVAQLEEQLRSLEKRPDAISQPAIQKKIESELQKLADSQQSQRAGDTLRPCYGVFLRVSQEISVKSRYWFDQRVASAGERILMKVASKERQLPSENEKTLRKLMLADLPAHHLPAASWQALQPAIRDMVSRRSQQWIVDDLVSALQQSKSPDDKDYAEDRFRQDIVDIISAADTQAHDVWSKLQKVLQQRYEKEVLPAVRQEIADQQARQYSPQLMSQAWTPTETDLQSIPRPLQVETLADLRVWNSGPPQPKTKVLQEAWDLWIKAAEDALAITQQARDDQLQIVEELSPSIVEQIRQDSQRTHDKWVKEFSRRATEAWRTRGATVAARYPDLFAMTETRIDEIVRELLPLVEKEQSKKPPAASEMKEESQTPDASDNNATPKPAANQPPQVVPQPKEQDATDSPDGQGSSGKSGSKGKQDSAANADETGDPAEVGDGEAEKVGDENSEESADQEPKGDDGEGQGKGKGEGGDQKERSQGEDAVEESPDASAGRIAPERRSFADWFYRIACAVLLIVILVMAVCWYFHVRYLRRLLAQYRRSAPLQMR